MPPRGKKPRTYDPVRIRTAVTAQFAHVCGAVAELGPEQLARPGGLGDWSVAELAGHIAWIADSLAGVWPGRPPPSPNCRRSSGPSPPPPSPGRSPRRPGRP